MPVSGIPIANTTVQHVTAEDLREPDFAQKVTEFNEALETRLSEDGHIIRENQDDEA
jgi:hypothetical protein